MSPPACQDFFHRDPEKLCNGSRRRDGGSGAGKRRRPGIRTSAGSPLPEASRLPDALLVMPCMFRRKSCILPLVLTRFPAGDFPRKTAHFCGISGDTKKARGNTEKFFVKFRQKATCFFQIRQVHFRFPPLSCLHNTGVVFSFTKSYSHFPQSFQHPQNLVISRLSGVFHRIDRPERGLFHT